MINISNIMLLKKDHVESGLGDADAAEESAQELINTAWIIAGNVLETLQKK